jgi:hypothetical protein
MNYIVVLFKNKKRKKIIKSFVRKNVAELYFKKICEQSDKIKFNVEVENSLDVTYEVGLLCKNIDTQFQLFSQDDIGRNIRVNLEDSDLQIIKIHRYRVPEKLHDWSTNKRITYDEFFKKHFTNKELKNVFTVNNKIIVQKDEQTSVYSLKNIEESKRLLMLLQDEFVSLKRADAIFVKDMDTIQRKYLYDHLEKLGIDKKRLYRQSTTFSERK